LFPLKIVLILEKSFRGLTAAFSLIQAKSTLFMPRNGAVPVVL